MKLFDSLRRSLVRETDESQSAVDFAAKVRREQERLQSASAGRLDAEIRGLDERLMAGRAQPDLRDLAELIALSAVFVARFNYRPLQRWMHLETSDEAQLVFATTFDSSDAGYSLLPGEKSWREHLVEFGRALHLGELFDDPLRWLITWRPSEPREHATKLDVLKAADLGTLTNLFITIAEWEIEQYASPRPIAEPDPETAEDLSQGLTDTRAMRLAIVDAWCRHPRIPVDYAEAVQDATAEKQIDFLTEKVDSLMELGRMDTLEKTGLVDPVRADQGEDNRFSLYS